jgi:hypothetical protein
MNRADIGGTAAFDFVAVSFSDDPPNPNLNFWDFAPNTGAFTYALTSSTTPPPPPSPTRKPLSPDKLPTIFGPSSKSRKDPEYSRFASTLSGGTRSVFCWNESDWSQLAPSSKKTIAYGYVEFRSPHQINLSPDVCKVLDRVRYHHQRPSITPAVVFGLITFTHETIHTMGITNEATTQCYAMQYVWRAARLLGAGAPYGQRIAEAAWRLYNPQVLPAAYLSRECHDGGKLDIYPDTHVWP